MAKHNEARTFFRRIIHDLPETQIGCYECAAFLTAGFSNHGIGCSFQLLL